MLGVSWERWERSKLAGKVERCVNGGGLQSAKGVWVE